MIMTANKAPFAPLGQSRNTPPSCRQGMDWATEGQHFAACKWSPTSGSGRRGLETRPSAGPPIASWRHVIPLSTACMSSCFYLANGALNAQRPPHSPIEGQQRTPYGPPTFLAELFLALLLTHDERNWMLRAIDHMEVAQAV